MTEHDYISQLSSPVSDALNWLERETHLRTNHARMLSGESVGHILYLIANLLQSNNILEIGVFTGYSSICLAKGLTDSGHLDAIEINDELEDIILEGYEKAGVSDKISLHFGDAKKIIPILNKEYDLIYIDANKREYCEYYNLIFDKVRPGGYIIADNVLWDGKVYSDTPSNDAQSIGIANFNKMVSEDHRVKNFILPLRDGLNIIQKIN